MSAVKMTTEEIQELLKKKPEIGISDYQKAVEEFVDICHKDQNLFAVKNEQYGNAIITTGVLGASVELIGAAARLRKLVLTSEGHGRNEVRSLIDVFMDLHNYSNIALMMLRDNNWEGI